MSSKYLLLFFFDPLMRTFELRGCSFLALLILETLLNLVIKLGKFEISIRNCSIVLFDDRIERLQFFVEMTECSTLFFQLCAIFVKASLETA